MKKRLLATLLTLSMVSSMTAFQAVETFAEGSEATEDIGGYKIGFYFLPDSYAVAKQ